MAVTTTEQVVPTSSGRDRFEEWLHEPGMARSVSSGARLRLVHSAAGCERRLGSLRCTGVAGHDFGCVFHSTSGVPDSHSRTSGE